MTPRRRAARLLFVVMGASYLGVALTLDGGPPTSLSSAAWKIAVGAVAGALALTAVWPYGPPRWWSYGVLVAATLAAGSRATAHLLVGDGLVGWLWMLVVAWQLRDLLDVCRWERL